MEKNEDKKTADVSKSTVQRLVICSGKNDSCPVCWRDHPHYCGDRDHGETRCGMPGAQHQFNDIKCIPYGGDGDTKLKGLLAEIERNKFKLQQNFYGGGYSLGNAYKRGVDDAIQFVFEVLNEKT